MQKSQDYAGGDYLILLPQYPGRFDSEYDGKIFTIEKEILTGYVNAVDQNPIKPQEWEFIAPGLAEKIEGYEGFEAIDCYGDQVFLTIEASPDSMKGYLISGIVSEDINTISLDVDNLVTIPLQKQIPNAADETILVTPNKIITIFEGNGVNINRSPMANIFNHNLQFVNDINFPNIEYRVTDATEIDEQGYFWIINYFWPGDKKKYNPNYVTDMSKIKTQKINPNKPVERLLQLQLSRIQ